MSFQAASLTEKHGSDFFVAALGEARDRITVRKV